MERVLWRTAMSSVGKTEVRGDWSDSTVGRAFALHSADPGLIPSIPYGPLSTARGNS